LLHAPAEEPANSLVKVPTEVAIEVLWDPPMPVKVSVT
jgi:hypothetical protein